MTKIFIIFQSFFFMCSAFCADLPQRTSSDVFLRFNEETREEQIACKTYQSPDGKTLVKLVGICHLALPSFFEKVGELLKDSVLIYELAGGTLEQQRQFQDRIKSLGELYWAIYDASTTENPAGHDALGRVDQKDYLSYSNPIELIHADMPQSSEISSMIAAISDDNLKSNLFSSIQELIEAGYIDPSADLIEQYKKILSLSRTPQTREEALQECKETIALMEELRRGDPQFVKAAFAEELRRVDGPELLKDTFGNEDVDVNLILLGRNQYIFAAFNLLLSRELIPPLITVAYGSGHMPFVHDFLLDKQFIHLENKDVWLTTAQF